MEEGPTDVHFDVAPWQSVRVSRAKKREVRQCLRRLESVQSVAVETDGGVVATLGKLGAVKLGQGTAFDGFGGALREGSGVEHRCEMWQPRQEGASSSGGEHGA